MLINYLKIAFRNLVKHPTFSLINIFGLSVGLSACMLIGLYLHYELSYDQFHEKGSRVARVIMDFKNGDFARVVHVTGTKVAPAFKRAFPEVESGVRMYKSERVVKVEDKQFMEKDFYYADSTFFDVFSFKLLSGRKDKALSDPYQVILTQSTARKYFGEENPLGKIIRINDTRDFTVTGVAEDCPVNSQIRFDFLASFNSLGAARMEETWWSANWTTFLLLKDESSFASLEAKIPGFMKSQLPGEEHAGGNYLTYHLEPFEKVHLYSPYEGGFEPNISIRYIYIFLAVAVMILAIACFTYANLTTARAVDRAREVGMRKVLGAQRKQVFFQFISESLILTFSALILGFLLLSFEITPFNRLVERELSMLTLFNPVNLLFILGGTLLIAVVAGSYPAVILSGFQPLKVLKGAFKTSGSGILVRKFLIVFQFAVSVFFIIATFVVKHQLGFIQTKQLGYDRENVIVLPTDQKIVEKLSTFKSEFKMNAAVKHVASAYQTPVQVLSAYSMWGEGMPQGKSFSVSAIPADEEFVKTIGFKVLAGSQLTRTDMENVKEKEGSTPYFAFTLNESAVKYMGWTPESAVGKKMNLGDDRIGEVKAVVADFHFTSMHQKIDPIVIFPDNYPNVLLVKYSGRDIAGTLDFLRQKWEKLAPQYPFKYEFMDEEFNNLYKTETMTGTAFGVFAFVAIFLAALGLLGLASFTIQQRIREIGIRKVLGASLQGIVLLISKDFLSLVVISVLVASPLAYFVMGRWLDGFVYRTDIAWWIFGVTTAGTLGIAFLTISWQAVRAALMNPVKSLKSE